jgi:hypothetical protein
MPGDQSYVAVVGGGPAGLMAAERLAGAASTRGTMHVWPSSDNTPWVQLVVVTTLSSTAGERQLVASAASSVPAGQVACSCASEYLVITKIPATANSTTIRTEERARVSVMDANRSVRRRVRDSTPGSQQ